MTAINLLSALWNPLDSYGRLAWEIKRGLERFGYIVNCLGPGAPLAPMRKIVVGGIFCSPASTFPKIANGLSKSGPTIGVSMFEGTHLPDGWTDAMNELDRIIVPSKFLPDIFLDNGVIAPIDVAPLGISDVFKHSVKRNKQGVFTFYATGDSGLRKGWHLVGQAFHKAFGFSTHVKLLYKARVGNMNFKFSNPNVEVIHGAYSDRAMLSLYKTCQAMVFPSSGEGFGFPPREFAATGGPVLTTNWGGTADDIEQWADPIPYRMVRAWEGDSGYGELGGRWAEANIDHIAEWLTDVHDNADYHFDKAMERAQFIKTWYTWDKFINNVLSSWDKAVRTHGNRNAKNEIQK